MSETEMEWVDDFGRLHITKTRDLPKPDPRIPQSTPFDCPAAWQYQRNASMKERGLGHGYQDNHLRSILHDPNTEIARIASERLTRADDELRAQQSAMNHADNQTKLFFSSDNMWQRYDPAFYQERRVQERLIDNDDVRLASTEDVTVPRVEAAFKRGLEWISLDRKNNDKELAATKEDIRMFFDKAHYRVNGFFKQVEDKLNSTAAMIRREFEGAQNLDVVHLERSAANQRVHNPTTTGPVKEGMQNNSIQPDYHAIDHVEKRGLVLDNHVGQRTDHLVNDTIQPTQQKLEHKSIDLKPTFVRKAELAFKNFFASEKMEHNERHELIPAYGSRVDHAGHKRALDSEVFKHKTHDLKSVDSHGLSSGHDMSQRKQLEAPKTLVPTKPDTQGASSIIPGRVGLGRRFEYQPVIEENDLVRAY